MKSILSLLTLLTLSTFLSAQTYVGAEAEIEKILASGAAFSQFVMDGDYEQIADSYTEDGKIFPNRRKIIEGREAIRQYWVLPEGVKTVHHKVTPSEIKITGEEAYDYGYYEGRTQRADGSEVSWQGKYVIVWRKVGENWKMYLDIWNGVDG